METTSYYSKHASLALMAQRLGELKIWEQMCESVTLQQKMYAHVAMDKLLMCLINMWMGGARIVEINTRLRVDTGLQRAFGLLQCAEQSTVSRTLNACDTNTVEQMRQALREILRKHGQVMQRCAENWLVLDVDMVGLVCGAKCEEADKGFFGNKRGHRGRQLGRVVASQYGELIEQRLYSGKRQLERSFLELIDATQKALPLREKMAEKTVLRADAGAGSDANINEVLTRGYHVLTKMHSAPRAAKFGREVTEWITDPRLPSRQVGWAVHPCAHARPTRQLVSRALTKAGTYSYCVMLTSLSDQQLCDCFSLTEPLDTPWPLLYAYDLRGGGIETQNRCDQQGLHICHRNKRSFAAQEIMILLAQLAHNVLIWVRQDLIAVDPRFTHYGLKRLIRDVLSIDGHIQFNQDGTLTQVDLNPNHKLAEFVSSAWPVRHM
jgi:Transposase DDE domain group 1